MWGVSFWRITFALVSMIILTATSTMAVLADSHEAAGGGRGGGGGGGGRGGGGGGGQETLTAVPTTGVGPMTDQVSHALLLGLVGITAVMAVLAVVTARRARA